jgi:Domain of unknown function (DUF4157)/Bacterial SH3 domain
LSSDLVGRSVGYLTPPTSLNREKDSRPGTSRTSIGLDFKDIRVHGSAPLVIQPEAVVNAATDPYEQEADSAAEQVMRACSDGSQAAVRQLDGVPVAGQRKPLHSRHEHAGGRSRPLSPGLEAWLDHNEGNGAPLPEASRTFFEPIFGHDFTGVRIHADSGAANSARILDAEAFTRGRDVYFGASRYQPESAYGRALLAHELTHVVQQRASPGGGTAGVQCRQIMPAVRSIPSDETELRKEEDPEDTGMAARAGTGAGAGLTINQQGVMACTPGSPATQRLRNLPTPENGANVLATLSFNDRVFVEQSGGSQNQWYQVTTDTGQEGWVPAVSVALDPPEPRAVLYRINGGDTPIDLVSSWYGPFETWWQPGSQGAGDARFYVAALAYANKGRAGMPSADDLSSVSSWRRVGLIAKQTIWKPEKPFLESLHGKVGAGSITAKSWEKVKSLAKTAWDWYVYGAAFVAGIVYGLGESIYDLVVGIGSLFKALYDIAKSIIADTFQSDAQALWNEILKFKPSDVEKWFLLKWNAEDPLDQAFFRGRVVGYIVMEILMVVFSDGILNAIKWAGKFAKIGELIAELPRIVKFLEAVKKVPAKIKAGAKAILNGKNLAKRIAAALASADPAVRLEGKVAEALGGSVVSFQKKFVIEGVTIGEIDVETTKAIIEVTGGRSPGKLKQITRQISNRIINPEGKAVIVYGPELGIHAAKSLENAGAKVVRTLDEIQKLAR